MYHKSKEVKKAFFHIERSGSRTFKYFNIMYAIALSAVAIVTIGSYLLVQQIIVEQQDDASLVNLAGRQRMLSQQISKNALLLRFDDQQTSIDLDNAFDEWRRHHIELSTNNNNSDSISILFDELGASFGEMYKGVNDIKNGQKNNNDLLMKRGVNLVLKNESAFLSLMDRIVNRYELEARNKIKRLQKVEFTLLIIILITLCLEVLFIFNPVGKKIKHVIGGLVDSESKANVLANELQEVNESLLKSNKDIRDINFALNEATIMIKTNREGVITYANQRYCDITHYSLNELVGRRLFENNMGGDESVIYEYIRDEKRNKNVWRGEIYDHTKDFTFFWLDVTIIPIVSMEGELYQFLVISSDITKRKETEQELQRLNEAKLKKQKYEQKIRSISVITGQEKERKRMSQEVHDGIGQMLTALKFGLESFTTDNEKDNQKIKGLKDLLHSTIKEVRRISSDLLPTVLNDFGLEAALKELIGIVQRGTDISITLINQLSMNQRMNKNVEINLYRICQESINNAVKYAGASSITIKLSNDIEFLNIKIEDNGIGFDLEEVEKNIRTQDSGNGLNNMKERAELVNGKLYINSRENQGTSIFVEVPLEDDLLE